MLSYKDISWEIFTRFCFVNYCPIHLKDSFGARVQVKRVFDGAPLSRAWHAVKPSYNWSHEPTVAKRLISKRQQDIHCIRHHKDGAYNHGSSCGLWLSQSKGVCVCELGHWEWKNFPNRLVIKDMLCLSMVNPARVSCHTPATLSSPKNIKICWHHCTRMVEKMQTCSQTSASTILGT